MPNFTFIFVCSVFWCLFLCSLALRLPVSRTPLLKQCETPTIRNGNVRLRQRGKLIRYQCAMGFTLYGERYSACLNGRWENPIPYCIKPGCPILTSPDKGYLILQNNDASALLFCQPGYIVAGSPITLCDGKNWDRSVGYCRQTGTGPVTKCDFESSDLCGWAPDPTHDIEWKRRNGYTMIKRMRPGPMHDHTIQRPLEGHYMIAESADQLLSEAARLISPLYPANLSSNSCFRLYYFMYGLLVGKLRIYIKPQSIPMEIILMDPKYKLFEEFGSHKNLWIEAITEIEPCDEDFQIVIEGTSGRAHLSDIAIDDVALLSDSECLTDKLQTTPPPTEEPGGVFDSQSCVNRCNETQSITESPDEEITSGKGKGGVILHCDCFEECEDMKTCCFDYRTVCEFGLTQTDDIYSTIPMIVSTIKSTSFLLANTTITTLSTTPSTTQMTTKTTTLTTPQMTTQKTTQRTTQKLVSPTTTKPTTQSTIKSTITSSTITSKPSTRKIPPSTPLRNITRSLPLIAITTKSTNIPTSVKIQTSKLTTPVTTPIKVRSTIISVSAKSSLPTVSSTTLTTIMPKRVFLTTLKYMETDQHWKSMVETTDNDFLSSYLLIIIIGVITIIVIVSLVSIAAYRRFRPDPSNYKTASRCKNANDEFSEIRYLTGEEQLDFTLQATAT